MEFVVTIGLLSVVTKLKKSCFAYVLLGQRPPENIRKTRLNNKFSDVFRGYTKKPTAENGLIDFLGILHRQLIWTTS